MPHIAAIPPVRNYFLVRKISLVLRKRQAKIWARAKKISRPKVKYNNINAHVRHAGPAHAQHHQSSDGYTKEQDDGIIAALFDPLISDLDIGRELADSAVRPGFLCEACALEDAADITAFGGWRADRASLVQSYRLGSRHYATKPIAPVAIN